MRLHFCVAMRFQFWRPHRPPAAPPPLPPQPSTYPASQPQRALFTNRTLNLRAIEARLLPHCMPVATAAYLLLVAVACRCALRVPPTPLPGAAMHPWLTRSAS